MAATQAETATQAAGNTGHLRRELRVWEALALSVGIMSPALAMAMSGAGPAGIVGRAVPLAFIFATIGLAFVAYGFVTLSRHFSHAGSVYGLTGATLGPRAGFFSGWALLGCYTIFTPGSLIAAGYFIALFCQDTGIWKSANFLPFALIFAAVLWRMALGDVRKLTRSLLSIEGVSVTLIVILMIVIFVRLIAGSAPGGATLNAHIFSPPKGVGLHDIGLASVFAFIAFAGFEGAASLGEETEKPTRDIPKAILGAVAGAGVFFLLCMCAQSLGFGTSAAGVKAFAGSSGPLFDLSHRYVDGAMANLLELGAAVSAFGSALGSAAGGARLLFAISRDGIPSSPLARVGKRGAPAPALALLMAIAVVGIVVARILNLGGVDAWGYFGTIGTLALLVAYLLVNAGALRFLGAGKAGPAGWKIVLPAIAVLFLGYVLYNELYPVPASPFNVFPYVVAAWLVMGLALVVVVPGLAERVGRGLASEQVEAGR
jgi:amino acid transporter